MLHTQRRELSEPGVLALKWRISLQPEAQAQGPELNEVMVRRGGEA